MASWRDLPKQGTAAWLPSYAWVPLRPNPAMVACPWCGHGWTPDDEITHCPLRPAAFAEAMRVEEV